MPTQTKRHKTVPAPGSRRRVWARVGGTLVTLMLLGLLGGIAYLRVWPPLRIVMSPSMEPAVEIGDVAVLQAISGVPRVGDVILVPVPQEIQDSHRYPEEVLHRVIEITPDGLVRTKGDNLAEPDPFGVPVSTVKGRMTAVIPGVGKAFAFITSPFGLTWLIAGLVLFGLVPFLSSQREITYAVEEYGHHLRSHTQILKSMSAASQELSATVVELRRTIADPGQAAARRMPPGEWPPAPALQVSEIDPGVTPSENSGWVGQEPFLPGGPRSEPMNSGIQDDGRPVLYDDERNPLVDSTLDRPRDLEERPRGYVP